MVSIGPRLRALREAAGMTQDDVSAASGMAVPNISRMESGTVDFRLSSLTRILDAMDLDIAFVPRDAPTSIRTVARRAEEGRARLDAVGLTPSNPGERLATRRRAGSDVSVEDRLTDG